MRSARASPSTSRRPRPKRVPLRLISPKRVVRAACEPALRQDRGEPKGLVDDSPARRGRPVRDAWEVKPCFSKSVFDNSVRVASRLSVRRIIARRIHASEVSASLSQSLLILRYLPSRASVRSTARRLARILNPRSPFGRFTISSAQPVASFTHSASFPAYPPVRPCQTKPRKLPDQLLYHQLRPVQILDVRRMNRRLKRQPPRVHDDLSLASVHIFARVILTIPPIPWFARSGCL